VTELTVLGASGFIGRSLTSRLDEMGIAYTAPGRDADLAGRDLGCVVYCVGVTADFRTRPLATVEAHVCQLLGCLRTAAVDSLVYLSSTRLYRRCPSPAGEDAELPLRPDVPDDLYDLSKAMGEAVALAAGRPVHVLRLSNVYGTDVSAPTFLASVLRQALETGTVELRTSAGSVKDYVSVEDVVAVIVQLATKGGRQAIYNVASGTNVSHAELLARIAPLTKCRVVWAPDAATLAPPAISISRLVGELGFRPRSVLDDLPDLVQSFRRELRRGGSPSVG
jgi:nucleoside-diphosphate-sugar epimerase